MQILYRSMEILKSYYQNIENKINIWVSNDPMYEVDPYTFDYKLRLIYVPRWPLIIHASSAIVCLGVSAYYHLFQIHSKRVKSIMQRLDFGGICFLIAGSSYSPIIYNLACSQEFKARHFFTVLITVSSILTFIACMTPAMSTPKLLPYRALMFVLLGLSSSIPLFYISIAG